VTTVVVAVAVGFLYATWPQLTPSWSERGQGLATAWLEAAVATGAGVLVWYGSWKLNGRHRLSWRLIGSGVVLWGMGSVTWFAYTLAGADPPQPGPPDVMYLAMIPLVMVGLALQPSPKGRDRALRSLVDGALVACSVLLLAWTWVLRDMAEAGVASSPAAITVNALYPIADVVVVVMAVTMLYQAVPPFRFPLGMFATGISLLTLSDVAYSILNAGGIWKETPLILDSGWVVGFAVIGGAGCALRRDAGTAHENRTEGVESVLTMVPSWLAGAALLFGVIDVSVHRGDLGVTIPLMLGITSLLLARQAFAVRQGRILATQLEQSVRDLAEQSTHDRLTGLHNRVDLQSRLARIRRSSDSPLAVVFADVDHLKSVNDSLGHEVGDRLIRRIAEHLARTLGPDDVTRFGGDEFVGVLRGRDVDGIVGRATRIVQDIETGVVEESLPVAPSMSAGLALWEDGLTVEEVMRRADTALVNAKQQGRRRVVLYEPELDVSTRRRIAMEPELIRAIEGGELSVLYQPVFSLDSGDIIGAEALVRWNHPEQGLLNPDEFLGHADALGLLERIGDVVLDTAVGDFAELNRRSNPPMDVAVNMSAVELSSTGLVRRVHDALSRHGLDPSRLTLEITEDVVIDGCTRDTIDRLRELGVGIAIDDFGTGNSSLRQLGLYPATTLKIDRSFVEGLGRRPQSTSVVRAILKLARTLGLATIAEGVERVEQMDELRALGCDAAQGWYFEKAQPLEHLRACLLDSGRTGVGTQDRAGRYVERT
jgi:diguanylate cyclase (GGDEF)-like protein